jgi:S-adenosylmethionine decarboxylase proenzyme
MSQDIQLGMQLICEFFECDPEVLNNVPRIRELLVNAARAGNATVITDVFHHFNPHGVSGVVVIAESHVAIHTWPEHGCASLDIFSCSKKMDGSLIASLIAQGLCAQREQRVEIPRGIRALVPSVVL